MKGRVSIKPLSVNECWQGRRFKTPAYKSYEKTVIMLLPNQHLPDPPFVLYLEFGLSNPLSDFDNPVKPICDILQKRYGFNDRDIHTAHISKHRVAKGSEYFAFRLESC